MGWQKVVQNVSLLRFFMLPMSLNGNYQNKKFHLKFSYLFNKTILHNFNGGSNIFVFQPFATEVAFSGKYFC